MSESPHLMLGAFAVDALTETEREQFEEHLQTCSDCAAELGGLLVTAARLGSAQAVVPPARLRTAVLAEIARTPQERQLTAVAVDAQAGPLAEVPGPGAPADQVHRLNRRSGRPGPGAQRLLSLAAAILAVVAVGLGALLVQARSDRDVLAGSQQQLTAVLTAPDSRSVAAAMPGGGRAVIVISDSRHAAALVGSGMPALSGGHVYQLWYMSSDNSAVSAGVFTPPAGGSAAVLLRGDPTKAAKIGLTVEPAGGSPRPTTAPILAVPITA